ncbi:MAG: transporter [Epsilonproteobacteria bacterium]|nr:transporter [Campylobacterota bacterium]
MNLFEATVLGIKGKDGLHTIEFDYHGERLCMMGLELPDIRIGSQVLLSVKSTCVSIGRERSKSISISNQIECTIKKVDNGEVLSLIKLDSGYDEIECVTTLSSSLSMGLKEGDSVVALIKASELFIKEVL